MIILYKDDDIEVTMEWYEVLQGYGLHTKVTKWSLSNYKKWLFEFGKILNYLKSINIFVLYVVPPDDKVAKFTELFGFTFSNMYIDKYKIMEFNYGNTSSSNTLYSSS